MVINFVVTIGILIGGIASAIFYGLNAWEIFTATTAKDEDKDDIEALWGKKFFRTHNRWVNASGAAFGWLALYILWINRDVAVKDLTLAYAGIFVVALLGIWGILPLALWGIALSFKALADKLGP